MENKVDMMRRRIREYRNSGKTLAEYCVETGLTVETMKYWMYSRKIEREASGSTELAVQAGPAVQKGFGGFVGYSLACADPADTGIRLEIKGVTITLERGFDKALLSEVAEALSL